jgi:hypothetical protein
MTCKYRYAMLTVDTEALPKRAEQEHVNRLIWGMHGNCSAGIREMCGVASDFGAKLTFFVDACGAYAELDQMAKVVRWLDEEGQDVQLHAHPEYLPEQFGVSMALNIGRGFSTITVLIRRFSPLSTSASSLQI